MLSYMVLTATLAFHHEPWRDEVDSWLMARDASVATILRISPDMGTPVGWYLLLKPFATAGLPFPTQQIITLVLCWTAVGMLIFQSPFSLLQTTCWCLSWYLLFEYSVVSRNYTLGLLGVFTLLGAHWHSRAARFRVIQWFIAWPLIIFSSVHFLAMAPGLMLLSLMLGYDDTADRRRFLLAHLWPLILFGLSVWILWPSGHGQMRPDFLPFYKLSHWQLATSLGVFPFTPARGPSKFIGPLFFCCWLLLCRARWRETLALVVMTLGVNAIFVFKYFHESLRFCGFNWIILVVAAWAGLLSALQRGVHLHPLRQRAITVSLALLTCLNLNGTALSLMKEIVFPYSDAGSTARYLSDSGLLKEPIACSVPPLCSSILGYLPNSTRLWYPGIDQWGTHMFWDLRYARSLSLSPHDAFLRAKNFFQDVEGKDTFIFLSSRPIPSPETLGLETLWESPKEAWIIKDERFTVYRWRR